MEARVVVAGTLDRLHAGHYALLHAAFAVAHAVEIWVTDDAQAGKKSARLHQRIRPFAQRCADVAAWCEGQTAESVAAAAPRTAAVTLLGGEVAAGPPRPPHPPTAPMNGRGLTAASTPFPYRGRFSLHALPDAFGPTLTDRSYAAIVCSDDTRAGCELINAKRAAAGLPPMRIYVVPALVDAATGAKLSSSALRQADAGAERDSASDAPSHSVDATGNT